jgi:hypothetical protein
MAFRTFDPASDTLASLVSSFFSGASGVTVVDGSVTARYAVTSEEPSTMSYYTPVSTALNIGAGLLLTNGDPTPPETNTIDGLTVEHNDETSDADLLGTITTAYHGEIPLDGVRDVTYLQFQVNVTDPALAGISLDLVFGSEEYTEYVDEYPDIAGVYVNGANYAVFDNSDQKPLAVLGATLDKFLDNPPTALPIEYDGVTRMLQLTAPVQMGVNTIKIAIADTGWFDYDSGLIVSNMQGVQYGGFGLAERVAVSGTQNVTDAAGSQVYVGDAQANRITLTGGYDVVDGGAGVDQVNYSFGLGGVTGGSFNGRTLKLTSTDGATELVNVERVKLADDLYFALDTQVGGNTYATYALLQATFNSAPRSLLSQWVAVTDAEFAQGNNLGDVSQRMIDQYAPGVGSDVLVAHLYRNVVGSSPSAEVVTQLASLVGEGRPFQTMGDLYAAASMLSFNTDEIAGVVGSLQLLESSYFA